MFSIKNSLADCMSCELFSANSCILETNCESFDEVEIIFIAENPGKDEVEKEVPLIGKAGQTFRKYFNKYHLNNSKYLLTNVVYCQTLSKDGKTGNPSKETINRCKVNCFDMIRKCNPKLIVLMGSSPGYAFGVLPDISGVTVNRGKFYKWEDFDVLLTLHPSYVNRNRQDEPKYEEDIKKAAEFVGVKISEKDKINSLEEISGPFYYKIPDKFYTSEYKLIDVQYLNKTNEVLSIFRDKNNKKVYHKESDKYVCYKTPRHADPKQIMKYEDLVQVHVPYKERTKLSPFYTYEGDVKITVKYCQDYYLQKKESDPNIDLNVLFLDIETYSKTREFSTIEDANDIIAIIGFWYQGIHKTYCLEPKVLNIDKEIKIDDLAENEKVLVFKTERELITKFLMDVRTLDPDVMTGWFADEFDLPYIIYRCKKLGINKDLMSPFNEVEIDYYKHSVNIAGIVVSDLLYLYKLFTAGNKESYKLDFIANLELKEGKTGIGANFSEMYRDNPSEGTKYNMQDVRLLPKLNSKLKHLQLQNKIREICKTNFSGAHSQMGQLDSLIVSFLKERGISSRNANPEGKDEKYEGAYVKPPQTGVHDYIVDFDFTSLYPSLIITYNIGVNTLVMKFEDYTMGYDLAYHPENLPENIKVIIDPIHSKKELIVSKDQLLKKIEDDKLVCTINGCFYKSHSKELSIYGEILEQLLSERKVYKKKMFEAKVAGDKENEGLNDIRQQTFKILANALYGVLGNNVFRFYNIDCARSITLSGQEALKNCIIESNEYVNYLKTDKLTRPVELSKQEVYSDAFNRDTKYIVTGDTDSLFAILSGLLDKKASEEEKVKAVLEYCDKIQKYLNDIVIPGIVGRHSYNLEKNRLEMKNELVIKRGLFLAKKRYVNHIIFNEGRKVDTVKAMGLETKRSDFSIITKAKLQELIELVLKSDVVKFSKLMSFVKVIESEFVKMIKERNKNIAKPVAYGKKLSEYKVLPQGVRGMLAWNSLEYNVFSVGSKGYLFKLRGIDLESAPKDVVEKYNKEFLEKGVKLDVIVLPDDVEFLPKYYLIDEKEMLNFAWIDRYNLLLEPLVPRTELMKF